MEDLRKIIKEKRLYFWEIAKVIGVSEATIHRWLRSYDEEHHNKILAAINKLEGGGTNDEIN